MFLIPCYGLAGVIGWFVAQKGDFWKGPLNVLVSLLAFVFLLWLIFGGLAWTAQTERTLLALGIGVTVCGGSGWLRGRWLKRS